MFFFTTWIILAGAILGLLPKKIKYFNKNESTKSERVRYYIVIVIIAFVSFSVAVLFYALFVPYAPALYS